MVKTLYRRRTVIIVAAILFLCMQLLQDPTIICCNAETIAEPMLRSVLLNKLGNDYKMYKDGVLNIRYTASDSDNLKEVADTARKAFEFNRKLFGYNPVAPAAIVVFPDSTAVDTILTGSGYGDTSGFYWAGVIGIVSLREWDIPGGPLYHETAHLFIEKKTHGNLPVWLSEGLAQYAEYEATGVYWLGDPEEQPVAYSYARINSRFSEITDQYSAYRYAFSMTQQMIADRGESGILRLLDGLAGGADFDTVFNQVYKKYPMDYFDLPDRISLVAPGSE